MKALIVSPPLVRFASPQGIYPSVFLAGSIEMGAAEDWQQEAIECLQHRTSIIYNPRRADWDSTWKQEITDPNFNAQVNWELDMIEEADLVAFYFCAGTKSPITLMELGIASALKPKQTVVACPEGFWRRGNVEIVCERAGIAFYDTLEQMIDWVREPT
jgi:hypothetical protein